MPKRKNLYNNVLWRCKFAAPPVTQSIWDEAYTTIRRGWHMAVVSPYDLFNQPDTSTLYGTNHIHRKQ